jgi:hypothetical protein
VSARVVLHVTCRIALLALAGGWLMGGVPVDTAIAGHLHPEPRRLGGVARRADPATAPLIAAELAGIDQVPVETVVAYPRDDADLSAFCLEHPSNIVLLCSRDSPRPIARIELIALAGNAS